MTAGVEAAAICEITNEGARDICDVTCGVLLRDADADCWYCDGTTTDCERDTKPGDITNGALVAFAALLLLLLLPPFDDGDARDCILVELLVALRDDDDGALDTILTDWLVRGEEVVDELKRCETDTDGAGALFDMFICWALAICDAVIDGKLDIVAANELLLLATLRADAEDE